MRIWLLLSSLLVLTLSLPPSSARSRDFSSIYNEWNANLPEGHIIKRKTVNGRSCLCPIPTERPITTPIPDPEVTCSCGINDYNVGYALFIQCKLHMCWNDGNFKVVEPIINDPTCEPENLCNESCNETIVITSDTALYSWSSLDFGGANYIDDCVCQLTVLVQTPATVINIFSPNSEIICPKDNIQFNGDLSTSKLCGNDVSTMTPLVIETGIGQTKCYTVTFKPSSSDGGITGDGFNLFIMATFDENSQPGGFKSG